MKTLYISDLDGTLLDKNAELSAFTLETLNRLSAARVSFSVASARTPNTASIILENLKITVPIILLNGAVIYDLQGKKYLNTEIIDDFTVKQIINIIHEYSAGAFMYGLTDGVLDTFYETLDPLPLRRFHDDRVSKFGKKFTFISNFLRESSDVIYFTLLDTIERLSPIYAKFSEIHRISSVMTRDNYSDDLFYLECFSSKATKYNAAKWLKKELDFDRIVGFGDNINDLPLFEACDEAYAVENAQDEVKRAASCVIDANTADGVARWLMDNVEL